MLATLSYSDFKTRWSPLRRLKWLAAIAADKKTSLAAKACAIAMADHASADDGSCYPSLDRLSADTGLSRNGVKNGIPVLKRRGWITVTSPTRREHANVYHLKWSPEARAADAVGRRGMATLEASDGLEGEATACRAVGHGEARGRPRRGLQQGQEQGQEQGAALPRSAERPGRLDLWLLQLGVPRARLRGECLAEWHALHAEIAPAAIAEALQALPTDCRWPSKVRQHAEEASQRLSARELDAVAAEATATVRSPRGAQRREESSHATAPALP
jgi:hypothetical protein